MRNITQGIRTQERAATAADGNAAPIRHDKLNKVDFRWYVVRTLPRQERKFAGLLSAHLEETENILEVYCPVRTTVDTGAGEREVPRPLFAGFVFVLSTQEAVTGFIDKYYPDGTVLYERRTEDAPKARLLTIPEGQMRFFKDFNENYANRVIVLERPYSDYAFNPKTGEPNEIVRVLDGPLKGREGYLARFRRERRLVFNMKAVDGDGYFAVSVPDILTFRVVRLHNTGGDRQSIGTRKERAADLLLGMLDACGYGDEARCKPGAEPDPPAPCRGEARAGSGQTIRMLHEMVEALAAKPSLTALRDDLSRRGHGVLAQRIGGLQAEDAGLVMELARYEHDNPGYARDRWDKHVIRPFLTPTSGADIAEGAEETVLRHASFKEIIRRTDVTEPAYRLGGDGGETLTTTYYIHVGIMPGTLLGRSVSPDAPQFVAFANWDVFLGEYFQTAGKANERLVRGLRRGEDDGTDEAGKLIESFRNFAPTLYRVLTDEGSPVKAVRGLKVGGETLNAMAVASADADGAKELLASVCLAICKEINSSAHLAVWRRYLRTVWLHR